MTLYIRILIALMKAWFRPRIGLFDTCETDFRVWPMDHDAFGHMTNAKYFSLTDVSILDYMTRAGYLARLARKGWLPWVVYEDLVMKRALRTPTRFKVRTRLAGWTDAYALLEHTFVRDGKVMAEGFTVARFVSRKGDRIAPSAVLDFLGEGGAVSPPLSAAARSAIARAADGYGFESEPAEPKVRVAA